jgi:hypothetical protein
MESTDEDIIIKFLTTEVGTVKLTKPLEKKLERWSACDDYIRVYKKKREIINMLVSKFEISKATALRDFYSTKQVYGSTYKQDRSYQIDLLIEEIIESKLVAKEQGNAMAMARCDANMLALIEKLLGESNAPDYSSWGMPTLNVAFQPETLGIVLPPKAELDKKINQLLRVDKEAGKTPVLNYEQAEDISDYFEVNNNPDS